VIVVQRQPNLLEIILALHTLCCGTCLLNGRQQKRDQNADNGYGDQQFDQREPAAARPTLFHS